MKSDYLKIFAERFGESFLRHTEIANLIDEQLSWRRYDALLLTRQKPELERTGEMITIRRPKPYIKNKAP